MRFRETPNELIITETPGCLWIFGSFFAVVGAFFVYLSLGGASNWSDVPAYVNIFGFLMGAIGIVTGLIIIKKAPATILVIDRVNDRIIYNTQGLTGAKKRTIEFADLKQFFLMEETDSDGDPIWSLGLELTNGHKLRISALPSPNESFKRNFVHKANEAIRWQPRSVVDSPMPPQLND